MVFVSLSGMVWFQSVKEVMVALVMSGKRFLSCSVIFFAYAAFAVGVFSLSESLILSVRVFLSFFP